MAYQTIGLQKGNSDSEGKLAQLHLPDLSGKSFLDLGCNMGFFCREARQRGARHTLGVDRIRKSILEARRLDREGEYIAGDWFDVLRKSTEQFDVIIHLSAFHYVTDQWEFLNLVQERLAPGGVLILECGVIDSEIPRYHYIRRSAFVKHVTSALLKKLTSPFDVTKVGPSVDQMGDPVPRFVYHCRKRQPTPVWDRKAPTAVLAQRQQDVGESGYVSGERATVPMDELIPSLAHCPTPPVAHLLQQYVGLSKNQDLAADAVVEAGLVNEFSSSVADLIPNCFSTVVLPGRIFGDGRIRQAVANQLIARGFDVRDNEQPIVCTEEAKAPVVSLLKPPENCTFQWQAALDELFRPKPVDQEFRMVVGNKPTTTSAWTLPSAADQRFECYLRVHQRSRPVKCIFEVVDAAKIGPDGNIFEAGPAELTVSEVVRPGDRYTRVSFDLPVTSGATIVRLSIKRANLLQVGSSPSIFVGSPRIVRPERKRPAVYQTIGKKKGISDSDKKLTGLRLPDINGKSFLDLGCNTGFFCRWARQNGARRVLGVDDAQRSIDEARRLDPDGEYIASDWLDFLRNTQEQFDVIVHLSAFHYVTDQWEFVNLVQERLTPGGLFILECGTIKSLIPRYHYIRRSTFTKHVTSALLKQLLSPFEVRTMGQSVDQSGDPVPRFVYHCSKRQPTALIVGGESSSGKSYLGRALSSGEQVGTVRMDELVPSLKHCPNPLIATLLQEYFGSGKGLEGVSHAIISAGLVKEFSSAVADLIPNCFTVVVIEGQVFTDGRIRQSLANQLIDRGFMCWASERVMARDEEPETAGISLLQPRDGIVFHWQASAAKLVRPMPVDGEMLMIVGNKSTTAAGWIVPSAPNQRFECSLRVHQKAKPVKITLESLDTAKVGSDTQIFDASSSETTLTEVIEGADRYTRFGFDLPVTSGKTIIRLSVKMADAADPVHFARVFVGSPRLVSKDSESLASDVRASI